VTRWASARQRPICLLCVDGLLKGGGVHRASISEWDGSKGTYYSAAGYTGWPGARGYPTHEVQGPLS